MQFVILGLLLGGPLSLYEVHKRFASGISLFYSASFGSLQRALRTLAADGSVTVAEAPGDARGKKLYSVTDRGRTRWRTWMLEPIRAGVDAETTALAKIFLLGRLPASDRRTVLDEIGSLAQRQTAGLRRLWDETGDLDAAGERRELLAYQRATLDYGLRAHRLMNDWLEELRDGVGE
ncbi:MAG: helix-turn-helix transcriptional regulator [Micropruina sp.]|uniref:helix-turn-helix transcriptional regulator n=1 Tax=Micropruina sp. TaxID=2737536 RepID=UPI0039E460C0